MVEQGGEVGGEEPGGETSRRAYSLVYPRHTRWRLHATARGASGSGRRHPLVPRVSSPLLPGEAAVIAVGPM